MRTILHIVGNRPQFVKLAVLHKVIQEGGIFEQHIIHTGQHFSYEMDGLFFKELNIPQPEINFNLQNLSANQFIGEAAEKLQQYFSLQRNSVAFVYGDTNTTLAAAIAAKRVGMPLLHFEAGVRTGDDSMPEEINRLLTDRLADINFCCTQQNLSNMQAEGYGTAIPSTALFSGDLMLDAFLQIQPQLDGLALPEKFILCTIHRAANLGSEHNLRNIFTALDELNTSTSVLMPLHPHTKKKLADYGIETSIKTLPAVGYPQMKGLLSRCSYLITDSGGTCREAFFSKKPSLVIMDRPFWPELIEAGAALQSEAHSHTILEKASMVSKLSPDYDLSIFGNGNAAQSIHESLVSVFATEPLS